MANSLSAGTIYTHLVYAREDELPDLLRELFTGGFHSIQLRGTMPDDKNHFIFYVREVLGSKQDIQEVVRKVNEKVRG